MGVKIIILVEFFCDQKKEGKPEKKHTQKKKTNQNGNTKKTLKKIDRLLKQTYFCTFNRCPNCPTAALTIKGHGWVYP